MAMVEMIMAMVERIVTVGMMAMVMIALLMLKVIMEMSAFGVDRKNCRHLG